MIIENFKFGEVYIKLHWLTYSLNVKTFETNCFQHLKIVSTLIHDCMQVIASCKHLQKNTHTFLLTLQRSTHLPKS